MHPHEVLSATLPLLLCLISCRMAVANNLHLQSMSIAVLQLPSGAMLMVPPGDLILGPALVNPLLARTLEHISDAPLAPSLWSLTMPRLDLTAPPSG